MNERSMAVRVSMRLAREVMRPMPVLVMFVVSVSMIVLQLVMGMLMLVPFG
jgi:hypothetical protein